MNLIILAVLLILALLFAVSAYLLKDLKKPMIVFSVIIVAVISLVCTYAVNYSFRQWVDMMFNNKTQHGYRIGNIEYYIPLPPKTIFIYRTSETQSKYKTMTSYDDIIAFFDSLSQSCIMVNRERAGDGLILLSFSYMQRDFVIEIESSTRQDSWSFFIDAIQ